MPQPKPIPDGFHALTPHLVIQGAARAIDFYKKAFGAQEVARMPGPDGKSIMHAQLMIDGSPLMLVDEAPQWGARSPTSLKGSPVTIHLYVKDVDATFKKAVESGAKVTMPVQDMFWGDRYGKVTDPFGHDWSIATHKEDVPPQDMERRAREAMAKMCKP
jgi:uncharacterized glyoxalase superfamily protein PhnB